MDKKKLWIAALACFLLAVALMLYPLIGNMMAEKHHSDLETVYTEALEQTNDEERENAYRAAVEYNEMLFEGTVATAPIPYDELLSFTENGVMGYIQIPKLEIDLPICHGTAAKTLERAVGHLIGSSLPVGGASTHAVLSAHSGLAASKLFSDLDKLVEGDEFYISVLGETLAYRVDQIAVVEPHDISLLTVEKDKDYVTLVTCTPFGVNTHRLLVRGERTELRIETEPVEIEGDAVSSAPQSTWTQHYLVGLAVAAVVLIVLLGSYFIGRRRKCKKSK